MVAGSFLAKKRKYTVTPAMMEAKQRKITTTIKILAFLFVEDVIGLAFQLKELNWGGLNWGGNAPGYG